MKKILQILAPFFLILDIGLAQEGLPTDYLSKAFHAGRRDSLRKIMPARSIAAIFSYPARTFSQDISYPYHQNPDLYYFSGYKEPNAVLLIFKETQTGGDGKTFNELFFIQKRDTLRELWTGRRMGVENVRTRLGFDKVYEGSEFKNFPLDLTSLDKILFENLPSDLADDPSDDADLYDLYAVFRQKAGIPSNYNNEINGMYESFSNRANASNLGRIQERIKASIKSNEKYAGDDLLKEIVSLKDSSGIPALAKKIKDRKFSQALYSELVASLREIKTAEEMMLLRKSIEISCLAHAEVMKAVQPGMSELEIQGMHEYIQKKYGAEYVGYPSIVGAGENGCILHYNVNSKTRIGNDMVLMDVGAEYHGYSADVTRTIPVKGKYNPEQKAIYDLVYKAQEEIFKLCREGQAFPELNKKAKEVLANGLIALGILKDKKQIGLYYPHGCSHHLGLDVHDNSNYGDLKENMVITVEPGIYIPRNSPCDKKWWGIAVRIEDDVRIGKDQCELLSWAAPRKSEDVEKKVAEKSVLDNFVLPALKSEKKAF